MIQRPLIMESITGALSRSRAVVMVGPRQCGKTTLARQLLDEDSINYFDLEDPASLARLDEPMTALRPLHGLVVIDEVQRRPDLFPVLRVLVDRRDNPARFLILGSASGELLRQSSESLAGRMEMVVIGGFSLPELGVEAEQRLWLRGGFPLSYLAASDADSGSWRKSFIWATHQGAEIDLILRRGGALIGIECKRTDTPRLTPSIRIAIEDLKLQRVIILYPGARRFPLSDQVEAVPLHAVALNDSFFFERKPQKVQRINNVPSSWKKNRHQ